MEKNGQGTHCTKMSADILAENTPNTPKYICPSPKVWNFNEKRLHLASVVRDYEYLKDTRALDASWAHFGT